VIAQVPQDSLWYKCGLRDGDKLLSVGEISGDVRVGHLWRSPVWSYIFQHDSDEGDVPKKVVVRVNRQGEIKEITLEADKYTILDDRGLGLEMGQNQVTLKLPFGESVVRGLKEPVTILKLTYRLLGKLLVAQESTKGLAGPLGIAQLSYRSVQQGQGNFIWLLALISINLGVINLLPLPLFDGGHMWILLLYEKIKGRPPTQKFLAVFQYAGLAFILGMVIFVTYNDILRWAGK
jgi:regulator of sigma E protease